MTGVKENDEFRRNSSGPHGVSGVSQVGQNMRSNRYYFRPEYAVQHAHGLIPASLHSHEPQRSDFSTRDYIPQEKMEELYGIKKDDYYSARIKEREEPVPPGGFAGQHTTDDAYGGVPSSSRAARVNDRFSRIKDFNQSSHATENRPVHYGTSMPPASSMPRNSNIIAGVAAGSATARTEGECVSRLLDLYGTLENRQTGSRSHHDIYGSLDGRASRLSDIFPTSEPRIRPSEYRSDETRSLSGREGALSSREGMINDLYRRRDVPTAAPPEYRVHDYRPRHEQFLNTPKPTKNMHPSQSHNDQDVIENPMYDVERRNGPPRTPVSVSRVPTPTTTHSTSHHPHINHVSSNPPTNSNLLTHSSLHPNGYQSNHQQTLTPPHPPANVIPPMSNTHLLNSLIPPHPMGLPKINQSMSPSAHGEPRETMHYTAAIAQQEENKRLAAAANRIENTKPIINGISTACSMQAHPIHNYGNQHQHLNSTSNSVSLSSNSITPSQPPTPNSTNTMQTTSQQARTSTTNSQSQNSSVVNNAKSTPRKKNVVSKNMSRKDQLKSYLRKEAFEFFGLDNDDDVDSKQKLKWEDKRRRLASRKYGPLKTSIQESLSDELAFQQRDARSYGDFRALRDVQDSADGETETDSGEITHHWPKPPPKRTKDSVAKMTWDGMTYVFSSVSKCRADGLASGTPGGWSKSRSYAPAKRVKEEEPAESDVADARVPATNVAMGANSPSVRNYTSDIHMENIDNEVFFDGLIPPSAENDDRLNSYKEIPSTGPKYRASVQGQWRLADVVQAATGGPDDSGRGTSKIGRSRIWRRILDHCFDNSDRRQYGMGIVGKVFKRSYKSSAIADDHIQRQIDEIEDYRPYFTWWVSTVQAFILLLSVLCYGFAPHGISIRQQQGQVLMSSLSIETVDYWEPENLWIGPRAADLIHLGSKFSPCMRRDEKIYRYINEQHREEKETGCCIRNDDSGCVQTSKRECSPMGQGNLDNTRLSVWKKWSEVVKGPDGRMSGSVCGQDPNYCKEPASIPPYEWPDDITRWPICKKRVAVSPLRKITTAEHMACEVVGHPCCIGVHGECRITTREFCNFVRGYFHDEATLCAQVSCLNDVCGMVPFYNPKRPDQFYRLWTSLFIHAGVFHLVISMMLQYFLMRDLEKLAGPLRIGIIYIVSGIAGNLASAIFVPYRAEVGPSGSQFGLLACSFVEVINCWPLIKYPWRSFLRLVGIAFVLFLMGLLPWIDNYAHIFGFIFGFLLSYVLLPYVSFGPYDKRRKILLIWVCLTAVAVMLTALIILFYVTPIYECKFCEYLNCIPLTTDFCAEQNINFNKKISYSV